MNNPNVFLVLPNKQRININKLISFGRNTDGRANRLMKYPVIFDMDSGLGVVCDFETEEKFNEWMDIIFHVLK